jgi:hypothetical protein
MIPGDEGEEDGSNSDEEEEEEEEGRRRKRNVREPLFSWEVLEERAEMLEYYTGFSKDDVKVLINRLQEVRGPTFFFLVCERKDV